MSKTALISVIVPVYKVEKYLKRSVDSILNQTYKNLEIILVDDGSPDNCPKMCDDYAKLDSRVKVIHKENGGVSSARNAALAAANGDYVGFVDADDYIHPKMYEILLKNAVENDCDCSMCAWSEIDNDVYLKLDIDDNAEPKVFSAREAIKDEFTKNKASICYTIWNKLIKKEVLNNLFFDETMTSGEDTYFASRVFLNCSRICNTDVQLYNYIQNEGSATNGTLSNKYKRKSAYMIWKRMAYDLKGTQYEDLFGDAFFYYYQYLVVSLLYKDVDDEFKCFLKREIRKNYLEFLFCKGTPLKIRIAYFKFVI